MLHVPSTEGLGGWFIAMTPWAWRKVPPHCKDKQTEDRIAKREHPAWSFVVQQLLEPMLDKATAVCCSLSLPTQPHFKRGERTSDANHASAATNAMALKCASLNHR